VTGVVDTAGGTALIGAASTAPASASVASSKANVRMRAIESLLLTFLESGIARCKGLGVE
jgi:hypothetical protein